VRSRKAPADTCISNSAQPAAAFELLHMTAAHISMGSVDCQQISTVRCCRFVTLAPADAMAKFWSTHK
jgi:hypothetical protein